MTDQLTSVRFPADTLETLRLLADLRERSVAAEIREAVAQHLERETSDPSFLERVAEKQRARSEATARLTEQLLARVDRSNGTDPS